MEKVVIFDMDGVIVDSEPLFTQFIVTFLTDLGIDNAHEFSHDVKGRSSRDIWGILIERYQLKDTVEEMVIRARAGYLDFLDHLAELPEIPGAIELIQYCHEQGYRLALASSASPKRIETFLTKLDLKNYFEVITTGDDIIRSKPAPDIFLLTAERLGVNPEECVVIEDAHNGVRAAKAAGMKCIAYFGSDHNTDDLLAADMIVNDFHAVVAGLRTGRLPV